jgi:hypothetical protein
LAGHVSQVSHGQATQPQPEGSQANPASQANQSATLASRLIAAPLLGFAGSLLLAGRLLQGSEGLGGLVGLQQLGVDAVKGLRVLQLDGCVLGGPKWAE